ncbi:MFS transporter [Lactococcus formosensis]|uniref:MFS transporter n=1 Tax=Lactococcus formosensis TaxID=1281486 RepID=UPI0022E4A746|nr:MFS transporter [Lactococcus formosensis]
MAQLMFRFQLYLYSVLTAMWIFQYEPLMAAKNVSTATSLQVLAIVQLVVIGSILLYSSILERSEHRNSIIRSTLVLRIVISVLLFVVEVPTFFIVGFLLYQVGAVGCDIFYESLLLEEVSKKRLDFGKYRMFGSLGYATSGFLVSGVLLLGFEVPTLLLLSVVINTILLFLNLRTPFSTQGNPEQSCSKKKTKLPLSALIFIFCCAVVTTLPGSFGYLFNGHLREQFSLTLHQVTLYVSIAVFIGSCISEVSAFYVVDRLIRKIGAKQVLFIGFLASILRWGLAIVSPNAVSFVATYLFHGINFAFLYVGFLNILKAKLGNEVVGTLTMRFTFIANLVGVGLAQLYALSLESIGVRGILVSYLLISLLALGFVGIFYKKLISNNV